MVRSLIALKHISQIHNNKSKIRALTKTLFREKGGEEPRQNYFMGRGIQPHSSRVHAVYDHDNSNKAYC